MLFLMSATFGLFIGVLLVELVLHRGAVRRQVFLYHLRACVRLQQPLVDAFALTRGTSWTIRSIMRGLHGRLARGMPLSEAIGHKWSCLPGWFRHMIAIGEKTGNLEDILDRMVETDAHDEELRLRFSKGMVYPLLLCVYISGLGGLLSLFAVPRFDALYADMGFADDAALSLRVFVYVIWFAGWVELLLCLAILLSGPHPFGPNVEFFPGLRHAKYFLIRCVPWLRHGHKTSAYGRWAAVTGLMLEAGYTLPEAAELAAEIESDPYFSRHVRSWAGKLRDGQSLASILRADSSAPRLLAWQVATAEGGAFLPDTLRRCGAELAIMLRRHVGILIRFFAIFLTLVLSVGVFYFAWAWFGAEIYLLDNLLS